MQLGLLSRSLTKYVIDVFTPLPVRNVDGNDGDDDDDDGNNGDEDDDENDNNGASGKTPEREEDFFTPPPTPSYVPRQKVMPALSPPRLTRLPFRRNIMPATPSHSQAKRQKLNSPDVGQKKVTEFFSSQ